jgi:glycosyltransferase involved in cell wall biosynthesis
VNVATPEETAVVIFSPVEWDFTWQSAQTIAAGLAQRGYGVVFLNPLPKRLPGLREVGRVLGRVLNRPEIAGYSRQPRPASVQVVNPVSLPDINSLLERGNQVLFARLFLRRLRRLLQGKEHVVVISYLPFPTPVALAQGLAPDLMIYACRTNWAADERAKHSRLQEEELFEKAHLVLADSPYLYEHASRQHSSVQRLPAMVDFDLFHRAAHAGGQRRAGSPVRCCYFGGIGPRIDVELLAKVSQQHLLRIIGAVRVPLPPMAEGTELLGVLPHPQLPRYLEDVDVLLFTYRVDEYTKGILPAKTFECFATGKPVVSTYLPSLLPYQGLVYVSQTHEEFLANIERAVDEPAELREKRIQVARENSADRWIDALSGWILNYMNGQNDSLESEGSSDK